MEFTDEGLVLKVIMPDSGLEEILICTNTELIVRVPELVDNYEE